ncbi:hypothetical protein KAT51_04180 [bacterium]|nr:hypothetical protein [bacterium]
MDIEKRLNKSGWKNTLVWGTELAPAAGNGILPLNAGAPKLSIPPIEEESAVSGFQTDLDHGNYDPVDFTLDFDARYRGLGSIIAQVFGSDGKFIIAVGVNDALDFKEGAGSELSVTLDAGTYTATELCAEIKAKMEAANALIFTVTYVVATRKFKIATTAAFSLLWNTGTNKATDISDTCGYNDSADDVITETPWESEADNVRFHYPNDPATKSDTKTYTHTLRLLAKMAGLFGTYATEKHDKIEVVPSVKPHKLTFSVDAGKIKLSVDMKGNDLIDDSATVTSMAAVTIPDDHNRILFKQGVFRMNAQDGAEFADGDKIKIKDFTLEVERVVEDQYEAGSQKIIESLENDKVKVKLTLNFNRLDSVNEVYFADWKAQTEKKLDIVFTGAKIEESNYNYFKFEFPRMQIEDMEKPDEAIIPTSIILRGLEADAAPTGMTGITKPVRMTIMNENSADLLV